jgi:Dolichyl-phosphate-mannose-protein mannosyltransferase
VALGALRIRRGDGWGIAVLFFVLGTVIMSAYVHVTAFDSRTHDIGSHLAVLKMVEKRHGIPLDTDCWECTQPPLYYSVAATLLAAARAKVPDEGMRDERGARLLQGLSAAIAIMTLACWLMTVRLALTTAYERALASALCTFWPTLCIEGCKFGNDPMLYLLTAVCVWQLVRWRKTGSAASLVAAGVFAGLAPLAKMNGFVAVAIVLVSLAGAVAHRPIGAARRWPRGASGALAAIATATGLWLYILAHFKHGNTHVDFRTTGQSPMERTLADFTIVDLRTVLEGPWVRWDDSPARHEFWNALLRSSLFGEYATDDPTTRLFAYLLLATTAALLALVAYGLVVCIARGLRRDDAGNRELALTVFGFLGFMIAVRLTFPIPSHNDFRFALPIVPCCAAMAALGASRLRRKLQRRWPHLATLPVWVVVWFCIASLDITLHWS